jgi:hypothetical protein
MYYTFVTFLSVFSKVPKCYEPHHGFGLEGEVYRLVGA